MLYFVLVGLGVFVLLKFAVYFVTFQKVSSLTLRHPKYHLKQGHEIPAYVGSVLQKPIQELDLLGFQMCSYSGVHSDEVQKVFNSSNDYGVLVKLKQVKIVNVIAAVTKSVEDILQCNLFSRLFKTNLQLRQSSSSLLTQVASYAIRSSR